MNGVQEGHMNGVQEGHMNGADRILAERQRQVAVEGWTPDHDDEHNQGELAMAAVCYAAPMPLYRVIDSPHSITFIDPWPATWSNRWDKRPRNPDNCFREPTKAERIRHLEKAGALIAAEIDRLLRLA